MGKLVSEYKIEIDGKDNLYAEPTNLLADSCSQIKDSR